MKLRERIYVAGQKASDGHDDPVAKTVACAHAAADEALLAVIDRAITDGIDFYPALCRTRDELKFDSSPEASLVGYHGATASTEPASSAQKSEQK